MELFNGHAARIAGTGVYIPQKIMRNSDFEKFLDTNDAWIRERTGIEERHFAAADESCAVLGCKAAAAAVKNAGMKPEDIDMVLFSTNTPDSAVPAHSCIVQDMIGASGAGAMDVQAGCTGGLAAMTVAVSGVESGLWNNVLVVAAERFENYLDWKDRGTCILFGDGAGSCVITRGSDGSGFISARLTARGDLHKFITYMDKDGKDVHSVNMKGNDVFKFVIRELPKFIIKFCADSHVKPQDVDYWCMHQANTRIIDGLFKRIGIDTSRTLVDIDKYGNTSSASMLIALHEAVKNGKINEGDLVAFAAFGAGMTMGAMLYKV